MEIYDNKEIFEKSWDENYLSEELIQAQWSEFVELKKVITELYQKKKNLYLFLISELEMLE